MKLFENFKISLVLLSFVAGLLVGGGSANAAYFDYTNPASYGTLTNLGPTVNSPKDVESLRISRDGLSLYFSSQREGGYGDYDLWVTTRPTTDANWAAPENLGSPPNSQYAAWVPSISSDGLTLYFSDGPYGNQHPGYSKDGDIWVSTRASPDDPWGEYTNVGANVDATINSKHAWAPCVSADGLSLYLSSHRSDPSRVGKCDLYVATRETTSEPFGVPKNLGPNINSSIQDHAPDISTDELTLFFSRGEPWNDGELWVTTRPTVSDPWGPAVQLPPHVDMESCFDVTPSLSPDGSTLYFTSHRPGCGSGQGDIWQVQIFQTADLNRDRVVDYLDLAIFTDNWLQNAPAVPSEGLVGYWRLDDGPGSTTASDSSGNNNDATLYGNPVWTDGRSGGALSFDGYSDYVDCGINAYNLGIRREATFCAWINLNLRKPNNTILSDFSNLKGITLRTFDYELEMYVYPNFHRIITSGHTLSAGWNFICGVMTGTHLKLYCNGVEAATPVSLPDDIGNSPATFKIAARGDLYLTKADGIIDEVAIFNRALSPEEIQGHYRLYQMSGDINHDGMVNLLDFGIFADSWAWHE